MHIFYISFFQTQYKVVDPLNKKVNLVYVCFKFRQFHCSKVDIPMILLGEDVCNSTFLFLDRLSKLGSRSTSMVSKKPNLL